MKNSAAQILEITDERLPLPREFDRKKDVETGWYWASMLPSNREWNGPFETIEKCFEASKNGWKKGNHKKTRVYILENSDAFRLWLEWKGYAYRGSGFATLVDIVDKNETAESIQDAWHEFKTKYEPMLTTNHDFMYFFKNNKP